MLNRGGKFFNRGGKIFPPQNYDESDDNDDDDESESSDESDNEPQPPPQQQQQQDKAESSKSDPPPNATLSSSDDDDDDDEDDDDDDDDDNEPSSRKRTRIPSDDEDDDDEDDDEDEEEIEEPSSKSRTKKSKTSSFIDDLADVEDDESEEPYGTHHDPHDRVKSHYTKEDIERENMDNETEELIRRQNERRKQASRFSAEEADVADIARQIEERHRLNARRVDRAVLDEGSVMEGVGNGANLSAVTQQSLLPSVSDPSMWMFSCPNGKEEELVYQIMNKCVAFARQGKPLGITGAVASQSKGKIYIESTSEPSVMEAIQGIRGLMTYTMTLVPISNMTTVLNVVSKKKPVKANEWVRMTRGHFKGDLALVKFVRDSGLKCVIQCVPRLDLTLQSMNLTAEEAKVRRKTVRPPQKFFNPQELAALGLTSERARFPNMDLHCDYFENNYFHDGYLLKEVTVGTMVKQCGEDEPPTLDELQRFRNRNKNSSDGYGDEDENEGSKRAKSLLDELSDLQGQTKLNKDGSKENGGLIIGDTVEIIEGDLIGMRGKLISIDGSTVKVKPTNTGDLGDMSEVEFLISQVRKHIEEGSHVKITTGRYSNETGVVVAVEALEGENDSTVTILTDITNKERSVRMSQVQESAEVASGQERLGGFELHDLVILSGGGSTNEVGVIVRVGREEFTVINNHGIVREVRPEEVRGKRNASSGRAVALDAQGNQIRVGDTVNVADGPHKGKSATIKRLNRTQLFLYSQTRIENAGIFVVRSRSCVLAGSGATRAAPNAGQMNGGSGGGPGGGRGKRDDGLIGKSVRIQAGNWKGYLGTVCDTTPTHVQVELHSRLKKVMVVRNKVSVAGDKFGATEDEKPNINPVMAATTPFIGGATPMHGGATPMHGGATPMHSDGIGGGFTPSAGSGTDDVWRPGGMDRPAEDDTDGGTSVASGWDSIANQQQSDTFTSSGGDTGGGWGSSNEQGGSTWAPSTGDEGQSETASSSTLHQNDNARNSTDIQRGSTDMHASAMGGDDDDEAPVWFMERVCVQLNENNASAVIIEVTNNSAVVELEDKSRRTVSHSDVKMTAPKEHDTVLVTGGLDVGVEAELMCIDGTKDAILKDSNEEFKIVDIGHLAKIVGDS